MQRAECKGQEAGMSYCARPIIVYGVLRKFTTRPARTKGQTTCHVAYSELLTPTESEIKELSFDTSSKTVHNAKVKLRPLKVRW